mgnify:CR=1 FL=1
MPKAKNSFHSAAYRRFQKRLRHARVDAKLTQRQAAQNLKRPPSFIAKIETGERRVDFIELQFFARLYKKPLSFFVD